MQIVWLGHSTFELRLDSGEVFVLDPWIDGNPKYPADYVLSRCDAILITHGHGDHFQGVIPLAKLLEPKVVSNYEIATWLESKGVKNTIGMNKGGTVTVGTLSATMCHAIHSSTIDDDGKPVPAGEPCGYLLRTPSGPTIYYAGDTAVHSDMALVKRLYEPEVAILPIGDLFTMDPKQAALAAELLGVKTVIPMHYGTFPPLTGTPDALQGLLPKSVKVQTLEPGVAWSF